MDLSISLPEARGGAVHSGSQLSPVYRLSYLPLNCLHCWGALQVKWRFWKQLIKLPLIASLSVGWSPSASSLWWPKFSLGLHGGLYPAHSENWDLTIGKSFPISTFPSFKNKIKTFSLSLNRIPWSHSFTLYVTLILAGSSPVRGQTPPLTSSHGFPLSLCGKVVLLLLASSDATSGYFFSIKQTNPKPSL